MNKTEGLRRISVVLRVLGWLAIVFTGLFIGLVALFYGRLDSLQIGVYLLPVVGGILLGVSYILNGFAQTK